MLWDLEAEALFYWRSRYYSRFPGSAASFSWRSADLAAFRLGNSKGLGSSAAEPGRNPAFALNFLGNSPAGSPNPRFCTTYLWDLCRSLGNCSGFRRFSWGNLPYFPKDSAFPQRFSAFSGKIALPIGIWCPLARFARVFPWEVRDKRRFSWYFRGNRWNYWDFLGFSRDFLGFAAKGSAEAARHSWKARYFVEFVELLGNFPYFPGFSQCSSRD